MRDVQSGPVILGLPVRFRLEEVTHGIDRR